MYILLWNTDACCRTRNILVSSNLTHAEASPLDEYSSKDITKSVSVIKAHIIEKLCSVELLFIVFIGIGLSGQNLNQIERSGSYHLEENHTLLSACDP